MGRKLRVLNVEDSEKDAALLARHLERAGFELTCVRVDTAETMKNALGSREWDVVLSDYSMPSFNALGALAVMKELQSDLPLIIISGTVGEDVAVEAMRAGAHDYLMKDNLFRLAPTIERELQESENRRARRSAEAALLASERKYRLLFDSNPLPMWVFDRETLRFLAVNEAAIAHYGFSREEFLVMTLLDLRPPAERPKLLSVLAEDVSRLKRIDSWKHWQKDGTLIDVEVTSHPIDFDGHTAVLSLANDVTEKLRSQEQLRLQSAALESAANGILITDIKGKISWANPAFSRTSGYAIEEIVGRTPRLLKSGVQDASFYREMWATILSGNVWHDEVVNRRKNGTLFHEDLTITPIRNAAGDITHFVGIELDVTERKRAEKILAETNHRLESTLSELSATTEQLWQASKLATMGELSASIAHELNNPLATVALRVETLLMAMGADDPQRRPLEIVNQEVDRMASLVNDLLVFSRRSQRQISTVDVREEIVNSVEFVQYHLRSRKIEVEHDFADSLPTIQADRQQFRQLFLNLLTNASDAMPDGGKLVVRASPCNFQDSEAVAIEFADSGEGIAPEHLEKVWEPFFTTKPEGKGTGLGLAICRRIVEEHGGTIDIGSLAGSGTTVRMVCPATTNQTPARLE